MHDTHNVCCDIRPGIGSTGHCLCAACGFRTCVLHRYIGDRGEWRCFRCFGELPKHGSAETAHVRGGLPDGAGRRAGHVLVIVHGLHICGAARHSLELMRVFSGQGYFISVLAAYGGGQWADRFLRGAHELTVLTQPSRDARELASVNWRPGRRIISAHYDYSIGWVLARTNAADVYAHFHTRPEFGHFTRNLVLAAGETCRSVFFPSDSTMSEYRAMLDCQPPWWDDVVRVLPNAASSSLRRAPTAARAGAGDVLRLAIVSRLDRDKLSLSLLIEVLGSLKEKLGASLKVRIAGDGTMAGEVRRELERNGLDERVTLLGWVHDIEPVYRWSDLTFLPSHSETMPYAVLESLSLARPVVAPAVGFFGEGRALGPGVRSFDPAEPDDAVDAILDAWRSPGMKSPNPPDHSSWRNAVLDAYHLTGPRR